MTAYSIKDRKKGGMLRQNAWIRDDIFNIFDCSERNG